MTALWIVVVCGTAWNFARAATINVAAGNSSALSSAVNNAKPGDTIVLLGGTYNTGITTRIDGTTAAPITVIGTNGATLNSSVTTTGSGIACSNDYWVFQNLAINGFQKSVRIDNGSHGILNGLVCTNSGNESIKLKNSSQYWLVENCSASNAGMEGYYCGDADQNWTGGVPDKTGFVTFYHDTAFQTFNDGFDSKEGTHDIRIIDCSVDWNNTVPGGNDEGDSGVYDRANGIQVVNLNAKNNGSVGNGVRANRLTAVDGVAYGSGAQIYGLVLNNTQGTLLSTNQSDTALYANYSMTNVAGGLGDSGHTQPNPATFALTGWSDPTGAFPAINLVWDNSHSAVGNGTSWDFNQQNFNDPGINGNIPAIFFQSVNVLFNDSNNGHYNINISASVSPTAISVSNSAGNYVFSGSGSIIGVTTLNKTGSGVLTIANSNSYMGATIVSGGIIAVNGNVSASPFTVASGAALEGLGSIGGSVMITSSGTLQPGNFFGATTMTGILSIGGTTTLGSGSNLKIVLGGTSVGSQYARLQANGQLNLGGTLKVSLANGYMPVSGNSFDILDWGSLNNRFSGIQLPSLAAPLGWDLSTLYANGAISVTNLLRGDLNRDGMISPADVLSLLSALSNLNSYEASANLTMSQLLSVADVNSDGKINNADVQSLVSLAANQAALGITFSATGGQITTVPEPTALALFSVAALVWSAVKVQHCRKRFNLDRRKTTGKV